MVRTLCVRGEFGLMLCCYDTAASGICACVILCDIGTALFFYK